MKNQFKKGIIAALIALTSGAAHAQVPVQWSRTLQLQGLWSGNANLDLGGQVFLLNYSMDFKTAVDGNAMTMDEWFSDPNLGDFKGANLIGLSASDGKIHWFSADNFGTAHEHIGMWLNPKHFYMEYRSMQGGQKFVEKINFRLKGKNQRIEAKLIATLDGDVVQILEGTLYKQNARLSASLPESELAINIFPNPSTGIVKIESSEIIDEIIITNESGQKVFEAKPDKTEIEAELKEGGIFFATITIDGKAETKKIIVAK